MSNKPVALTQVEIINALTLGIPFYTHPVSQYKAITNTKIEPTVVSYTHPVKDKPHPKCDEACMFLCQMRELTDEEIWDFINALCLDMGDYWELTERNAIPMIRAILRKASEK